MENTKPEEIKDLFACCYNCKDDVQLCDGKVGTDTEFEITAIYCQGCYEKLTENYANKEENLVIFSDKVKGLVKKE